MAKQRKAHEVIRGLVDRGYSFRQLCEHYGLSPSTLHSMANNESYRESAEMRDLINASKPKAKPKWADRIKSKGQ